MNEITEIPVQERSKEQRQVRGLWLVVDFTTPQLPGRADRMVGYPGRCDPSAAVSCARQFFP